MLTQYKDSFRIDSINSNRNNIKQWKRVVVFMSDLSKCNKVKVIRVSTSLYFKMTIIFD